MTTFAQADRQAQIDAVNQEFGYHLQAAGLKVHSGASADTPEQFRHDTVRRLQETLPPVVNGVLRARLNPSVYQDMPEIARKIERNVLREVVKAAHASPVAREIIVKDAAGRKTVEFIGGKLSWMDQFRQQPRLMRRLGDVAYAG